MKVRLVSGGARGAAYTGPLRRGGRVLGEIEESFIEMLAPRDTFLFGGEILALRGIVENEALVSRANADAPKIPSYAGGKFPLSTYLAMRVRKLLWDSAAWDALPEQVAEWLELQRARSALPPPDKLLVEILSARRALLSRPLSVRGAPRPYDARHVADAPHGARRAEAARLRRQ